LQPGSSVLLVPPLVLAAPRLLRLAQQFDVN